MEVCIKPCAPVCEDVYFVCKRVLEHGNVFSGLQAVITQEIILLCIAIQLFQFLQHPVVHRIVRNGLLFCLYLRSGSHGLHLFRMALQQIGKTSFLSACTVPIRNRQVTGQSRMLRFC